MPLTALDIWNIQQQRGADRAAVGQQAQQQATQAQQQYQQQYQQQAQQQYDWQLAQQQLAMQYAQWQYGQQQYKDQQARSDKLSAEYQKKIDQANQKNESRYLDILAGRTDTRNRVLGDLANWGNSQIVDANDRNKSLDSQMQADVYSRGFGGSPSMLNSAHKSAANSLSRDLGRINDDIINRRTSADASQSEGIAGFMERRNDVPPDLNQLISLQQGLGRSGPYLPNPGMGGFGGGYGGGYGQVGGPQPYNGGPPPQSPFPYTPNPGMGMQGNVNRNYRQQPSQGPLPYQPTGMFANESIPGDVVGGGPVSQPAARGFTYRGDNGELARRQAMSNYMQVYNNEGDNSLDHQRRVRDAQQQMVLGGYGQWNSGQQMPLIPGMAGGPVGAPSLLPSLPYGGGGYGQGYRRGPQQNSGGGGRQMWSYPPALRTPRQMPLQPMAATTNYDWPVA